MKKQSFLRKILSVFGIAIIAAACAGCGQNQEEAVDENCLVVFNYGDYVDTDTIRMFEEETGIQVKYEEYVTP